MLGPGGSSLPLRASMAAHTASTSLVTSNSGSGRALECWWPRCAAAIPDDGDGAEVRCTSHASPCGVWRTPWRRVADRSSCLPPARAVGGGTLGPRRSGAGTRCPASRPHAACPSGSEDRSSKDKPICICSRSRSWPLTRGVGGECVSRRAHRGARWQRVQHPRTDLGKVLCGGRQEGEGLIALSPRALRLAHDVELVVGAIDVANEVVPQRLVVVV